MWIIFGVKLTKGCDMLLKGNDTNAIAIIGMSGCFPGAKDVDEYWNNIRNGIESISFFNDDEELRRSGVQRELLCRKDYIRAKGVIDNASLFDAVFFKFTEWEARITDPQFRRLLETAWSALEDAAYVPGDPEQRIGLFAGASNSGYYRDNLLNSAIPSESPVNDMSLLTSNSRDFLATLLAYKLNLTGPCVTVQTACSTSLVAICLACESLLNGGCDLALAGGVSITTPLKAGYLYQEGMILSPDGHCRAFDETANGAVPGNGAGIVVLKKLTQAIEDHDHIHAIIKGFAVNNDGTNKIGFTAPSVDGQSKVIQRALNNAKIEAGELSYIEAHGTGTLLGDPIEIRALKRVFSNKDVHSQKGMSLALGTVKSNIGHLDVAAGIAGVIKTVQALKHKIIPPCINFTRLNPEIDFTGTPFNIPLCAQAWPEKTHARFAGVSSFGIGGTNAHIILQEAAEPIASIYDDLPVLLILSARRRSALIRRRHALIKYIQEHPHTTLRDIAFTLQVGRRSMEDRFVAICNSKEQALTKLNSLYELEMLNMDNERLSEAGKRHYFKLAVSAKAWLKGEEVAWRDIYAAETPYRVSLPSYPFERREYWVEPQTSVRKENAELADPSLLATDQDTLEEQVKVIFQSFLGLDKINSADDFYDLGGDSLLELQLIEEIRKKLGVVIPLNTLLNSATPRALANYIRKENK